MTRWLLNRHAWVFVLLTGAMPLGTVADCNYVPGYGGTLYYDADRYDDDYHGGHYSEVVIVDDYGYDYYYEDVWYEDVWYDEVYYEDDYCDSFFFWDCWW
jgi:hypothetical protein